MQTQVRIRNELGLCPFSGLHAVVGLDMAINYGGAVSMHWNAAKLVSTNPRELGIQYRSNLFTILGLVWRSGECGVAPTNVVDRWGRKCRSHDG